MKWLGSLTTLFDDEVAENHFSLWERWTRCAMGLKCSPYHTIKAMLFAIEFLKGLPWNKDNPFNFKETRLNLPGSESYNPSQSWFSVMNLEDALATILATYVDDEQVHASSEEKAWRAAHQIATREAYLGIQDAAQKRHPPSQTAGTWAGSIICTNESEVVVVVSQDRWNKTKSIISSLYKQLETDPEPQFEKGFPYFSIAGHQPGWAEIRSGRPFQRMRTLAINTFRQSSFLKCAPPQR